MLIMPQAKAPAKAIAEPAVIHALIVSNKSLIN
jgi:hypothetical protein